MLKPWPVSRNHEELFMQRCQWLMGWALRLTDHNREQAKDLVHDCFVHFTISPRIEAVEQNLEGYLYTMLRPNPFGSKGTLKSYPTTYHHWFRNTVSFTIGSNAG